jgi:microtubule-associated protein-like 6
MLSIAFAPIDITLTGSISGDIFIWKGHILSRVIERAHTGPIFAMYTAAKSNKILTAGKERNSDALIKSWDTTMKESQEFKLSQCPKATIRSVCIGQNGKILVGTQDSDVLEIDPDTAESEVIAHGHSEGELWGLAVCQMSRDFVTASCDKSVCTWSLDNRTLLSKRYLDQKAASTDVSPSGQLVAVGLHNGEFLLLKFEDLSVVAQKRDRSQTIQAIKFSPDETSLAVGSDDNCVDIYDITSPNKGPQRVGSCRGVPSYVTHIDWSTDSKYLQVCSGYYQKLIFEVSNGKIVEDADGITWSSWTSILGEEVQGIWPKNADKGDINTAHVNPSATAVATGDDDGCVKLFGQFPVAEPFVS